MADLLATTVDTALAADRIRRASDNGIAIDVSALPADALYTRQYVVQTDTQGLTAGTTWVLAKTFPTITDIQAGSKLLVFWTVPSRNDWTNWGGCIFELQMQKNGGAWESTGGAGHIACMAMGTAAIETHRNTMLLDPGFVATGTVAFRIWIRSYQSTMSYGASSRDINAHGPSGGATMLDSVVQEQMYAAVHVREIAKMAA